HTSLLRYAVSLKGGSRVRLSTPSRPEVRTGPARAERTLSEIEEMSARGPDRDGERRRDATRRENVASRAESRQGSTESFEGAVQQRPGPREEPGDKIPEQRQ